MQQEIIVKLLKPMYKVMNEKLINNFILNN